MASTDELQSEFSTRDSGPLSFQRGSIQIEWSCRYDYGL